MALLAMAGGIEYAQFTLADRAEMVILLAETFARRDPPAVAVGLTPGEFQAFVELLCAQAAMRELTIIARGASSGEMAGALLIEDGSSPPPEGMGRLSAKFRPIFDLLGPLECSSPVAGEVAHFFLLGVAERFSGRGIAREMVRQGVAHAAQLGYRRAVAEATNRTSQHVFRQEGFVERRRASYTDYRYEGRAVFASIAEEGGPMSMEKWLGR